MKHNIILLILFLLLLNCNPKKPGQQGGENTNGGETQDSDKEIEDLKKRLADRNKSYKSLRDRLADREGDLEETEDDLDDVEDRLDEIQESLRGRLTPEEREALEDERDTLRGLRSTLQTRVGALETERDCWKKTKLGLCGRTPEVRDAILAKFSDISDCADINYCHLETITDLDLSGNYVTGVRNVKCSDHILTLKPRDFFGLTKLETLNLSGNCLDSSLEGWEENTGFFRTLDSIIRINLLETEVNRLAHHFFEGVLDTLEDGGVGVQDFTYCADPESPFKSKLGGEIYPHTDYSASHKPNYCYGRR